MIGYRCKCGFVFGSFSGMTPADCSGCSKCGTTLASNPDGHKPIAPHDFVAKPVRDADQPDATITRCSKCLRTKRQIEKEAAA